MTHKITIKSESIETVKNQFNPHLSNYKKGQDIEESIIDDSITNLDNLKGELETLAAELNAIALLSAETIDALEKLSEDISDFKYKDVFVRLVDEQIAIYNKAKEEFNSVLDNKTEFESEKFVSFKNIKQKCQEIRKLFNDLRTLIKKKYEEIEKLEGKFADAFGEYQYTSQLGELIKEHQDLYLAKKLVEYEINSQLIVSGENEDDQINNREVCKIVCTDCYWDSENDSESCNSCRTIFDKFVFLPCKICIYELLPKDTDNRCSECKIETLKFSPKICEKCKFHQEDNDFSQEPCPDCDYISEFKLKEETNSEEGELE